MLYRFTKLLTGFLSAVGISLILVFGLLHLPGYLALVLKWLFPSLNLPLTGLLLYAAEAAALVVYSVLKVRGWLQTRRQQTRLAAVPGARWAKLSSFRGAFAKPAVALGALAVVAAVVYQGIWKSPERAAYAPEIVVSIPAKTDSAPWSYRLTEGPQGIEHLEVFRDGRLVYAGDHKYLTIVPFDSGDSPIEPIGSETEEAGALEAGDITGDGIPDLLLSEACGCSAGMYDYTLISLGDKTEEVFTNPNWSGELTVADVDGDRRYELIGQDYSVTSKEGEGFDIETGIPAVPVILQYQEGRFRLATELMKRHPFKADQPPSAVEKITLTGGVDDGYKVPEPAYNYLLQLIYRGDGERARQFVVNRVIPSDPENSPEAFWLYLVRMVRRQSPFWEEIAASNNWASDIYLQETCPY